MELLFNHGDKQHRVVYILYFAGKPHEAVTERVGHGYQENWDFETDCWDDTSFMYYNSGGGGKITELQEPTIAFVESQSTYWLHPEAAFSGEPNNTVQLEEPIEYEGEANIFKIGREVYDIQYCRVCDRFYDDDWCPTHHREKRGGGVGYRKPWRKKKDKKETEL